MFAEALGADLAKQAISTEVEAAAAFGDRHHAGAEQVAAFGLGEEAGLAPDDVGRSMPGVTRKRQSMGSSSSSALQALPVRCPAWWARPCSRAVRKLTWAASKRRRTCWD